MRNESGAPLHSQFITYLDVSDTRYPKGKTTGYISSVTDALIDGNVYYYRKDISGDIINNLDSNGKVVVKYVYDAWGNHKVLDAAGTENTSDDFIGNINPIRYRGYYYDRETNLYYLISRYYDPEIGRFINNDSIDYIDPESRRQSCL